MPILMSRDNPDGHKLEDLLVTVGQELSAKTSRLAGDRCPTAKFIVCNNQRIVDLLNMAVSIQRETLDELKKVGPDQGPRGTPRVGPYSNPTAYEASKVTR